MENLVKVAETKDVPEGKSIPVEFKGKTIALFNVKGKIYAIDDECTHAGGPLSDGPVEGLSVVCPWHGATFDITNGKVLGEPACESVTSYTVHIDGDDIKLEEQQG